MYETVPNAVDIVADLHGGPRGIFWRFSGMARASSIPPRLKPYMTGDEYEAVMQAVNESIEKNMDGCGGMCADRKSKCLCAATILTTPCLLGFLLIDFHDKYKTKWTTTDIMEALRPWYEDKGLSLEFICGTPPGRHGPGRGSTIRIFLPESGPPQPSEPQGVRPRVVGASSTIEGDDELRRALEAKDLGEFFAVLTQQGCTMKDLQDLSSDELEPFIKAAGMNLMQGTKFKRIFQ